MKDFKSKFITFIEKHIYIIFFTIITILSIIIRTKLLTYPSGDYDMFLSKWFIALKKGGGLKALGKNIGNYNIPYLVILAILTYLPINSLISIKLVSITFDYLLAITVILIVDELFKNHKHLKKIKLLVYSTIIFLPTVILNSAYWAQSDSIYTTFTLLSILYLLRKKYNISFIYLSIAFAFKLQTIFILPVYILIYLRNKDISIRHFLIIPIINIIMFLPAMIMKRSFVDCIKIYVGQIKSYDTYLTLNFPNIYSLFSNMNDIGNTNLIISTNDSIATIGIFITLFIFVILAFLVIHNKVKFTNQAIIDFSLWSILICTFFLPRMHDRYLYMGDIISIIYFLYNKRKYYIPIIIELISLYTYIYLLFAGFAINIVYMSILNLFLIIIYSKDMYQKYFLN